MQQKNKVTGEFRINYGNKEKKKMKKKKRGRKNKMKKEKLMESHQKMN
jgi:hypothetical protein